MLPQIENELWMRHAIKLAAQAEEAGEVPVGAVLIREGEILGEGWNSSIGAHDPSAHAEIMALRAAGIQSGNYRLPGSCLYVTLEPCVMCVGAILHARVAQVVFGAFDPKTGAAGSVFSLLQDKRHFHDCQVTGGILADECAAQLQAFFRARRAEAKRHKAVTRMNQIHPASMEVKKRTPTVKHSQKSGFTESD